MEGICDVCWLSKVVHKHHESGKPTCAKCYGQCNIGQCVGCDEVGVIEALGLCGNCYRRSKVGQCVECKKTKIIQALGMCYGCYKSQWRANLAANPA